MVCRGVLWLAFWRCVDTNVFAGFAVAEQASLDGCLGVAAGEALKPAMPGTSNTMEISWHVCQARCSLTWECAGFTFLQNGTCSLHGSSAILHTKVLAISGPPACGSASADAMPVPQAAVASLPQVMLAPLQLPGLLTPQTTNKQLLGHVETASMVPLPTTLPQVGPAEPDPPDGIFLTWKELSALLLLACLLCAGLAFCALWLYAQAKHEDADDVQDRGFKTRGSDLHLEEEVIYPEQTQIRWYPNLERHPSFIEELMPRGLRASVDSPATSDASASTLGATNQRGGSVQPSSRSGRSHRSLTLSWHCRVGDSVEVFSKCAGKWVRCQIVSIHGSRMTVADGGNTRRINLRDRDLNSYFRPVSDNILT